MQFWKLKIHKRKTIERRFHILNTVNTALVVVSAVGLLALLFVIAQDVQWFHAQVSLAYPLIHFLLFVSKYVVLIVFTNVTLLSRITTKQIGIYKTDWIVKLWDAMIPEHFDETDEIPSLYLVETLPGYASVVNSLVVNRVKKLNAITISQELFHFLHLDEIQAVLAHEIGHFKHYTSIACRIAFLPFLWASFASYILTAMVAPQDAGSVFVNCNYALCFLFIRGIWLWPSQVFQHDAELLSDLYAARKHGRLSMINALIKMYQLSHVDLVLNREIAKFVLESDHLNIKDMENMRKSLKRMIPKKIYDENLIEQYATTHVKDRTWSFRKPLSKSARKKRDRALRDYLKRITKLMDTKIIPWYTMDTHKLDGRIDAIEYHGFIEALKDNPELQLFKTPQDNIGKMKFGTHPTLRERILFLDANCSPMHEAMNNTSRMDARIDEGENAASTRA